jgi:mannosylglycerate hydrolase
MTTLHIVPHTHWDREWYIAFQESRIRLVHLIDLVLDILEKDPDHTYYTLDGQTSVLDDYLEVRPERRAQLERLIREGRVLVGPWMVLPDEFLVSPESMIRNLRQGARSAREIGGPEAWMDVGYVPDPFGHIGQLPQILRGFGIDVAVFRRGLGDDPVELLWEAPDGSRVLVSYLRDGYDNAARLPTNPGSFATVVRSFDASLAPHSTVSHRLLMNGTDHHEPQPELPALLRDAESGADRWLLSTLPAYVEEVRREIEERGIELPVRRGELRDPSKHHLLPGVLSSRSWIKQRNDACERLLEHWAEPYHAWAELLCAQQPDRRVWTGHLELPRVRGAQGLLDHAWRLLLECHPHDSICGCSIDTVHEEMRTRFDQSQQIAEEITRQSLVALAEQVDTKGLERHGALQALVVFNPAPLRRNALADVSVELGAALESFEVVDAAGEVLPHRVLGQTTKELAKLRFSPEGVSPLARGISDGRILDLAIDSVRLERRGSLLSIDIILCEGGDPKMDSVRAALEELDAQLEQEGLKGVRVYIGFAPRVELQVLTRELPPHGYRALGLRPAQPTPVEVERDAERRISNELLEVEAADDGTVTLRDLRSGESFTGLLALRDRGERGDSYTTDPLDDAVTLGSDVSIRREIDSCEQLLEIRQTLLLPARLEADRSQRSDELVGCPVCLRVSLVSGVPRADVEVEFVNGAEDHRLELLFPTGAAVASALYDGHFELLRRPTQIEQGAPDWQEQPRPEQPMRGFVCAGGLLVATHGLREASVSPGGEIGVTLLRCFGWLSRDDLSTRAGGAGPPVETPGGQCPGPQHFELSIVPVAGDEVEARRQADAFQMGPRGVGTRIQAAGLPESGSLLETEPAEFRLTAVHVAEDRKALIVRGVHHGAQGGEVVIRPHAVPSSAERVRLDETPLESVTPDPDGALRVSAGPNELVTLRLQY